MYYLVIIQHEFFGIIQLHVQSVCHCGKDILMTTIHSGFFSLSLFFQLELQIQIRFCQKQKSQGCNQFCIKFIVPPPPKLIVDRKSALYINHIIIEMATV